MNFDEAFKILIDDEHEGSRYVDDPNDKGGETKYGISKASFPDENIAKLTEERAKELYKMYYWDVMRCDELPCEIRYQVFDFGVNAGVARSIKLLQTIVGADVDGVVGKKTLYALCGYYTVGSTLCLREAFFCAVINYYCSLSTFKLYGRGWIRRVAANMSKGY